MGGYWPQREVCGQETGVGHRTILIGEATAIEIGGAERERQIGAVVIVRLVRPCPRQSEVLGGPSAVGEGDVAGASLVRVLLMFVVRSSRVSVVGDGDGGCFTVRHRGRGHKGRKRKEEGGEAEG